MESGSVRIDDAKTRTVRNQAGEFTLNLVKALLQTGWYSPEHSLARAATEDLFRQFHSLTEGERDLSYVLVSTVDERGVMIDGLLPEPIEVAKALRGILGDHFVAKFHDYFIRNQIASFTVKRRITEDEFKRFLNLWVTWASKTAHAEAGHAVMSDELTVAGILSVTVVGMDEVPGARRHLPWPVKVALGRLRKDLRRIPMLRDADEATLARLKVEVIEDVVRPLSRPPLIVDLLLNADLVAEGQDVVTPAGVEDGMVQTLGVEMVHKAARLLNETLARVHDQGARREDLPGWDLEDYRTTLDRVTRKVLVRLAEADFSDAHGLLQKAYSQGLIDLDTLPEDLRNRIRSSELTDWFLKDPNAFYRDFANAATPAAYRRCASLVKFILPELVGRGEVRPLTAILAILHRHLNEPHPSFPGREDFARDLLRHFEEAGHIDRAVDLAVKTTKEGRGGLVRGLILFRESIVPALLLHLVRSQDASVRKAALGMLEQVGAPAAPFIVAELQAHRHPWYVVRNLVVLLGSVADPHDEAATRAVSEYRDHPRPQVREACLEALVRIQGPAAGAHLAPFLDDPEPHIVRRAVHHAGAVRYSDPAFVRRLLAMLAPSPPRRPAGTTPPVEARKDLAGEALASAVLSALARYGPDLLVTVPEVESTLCGLVRRPSAAGRLLSRLGLRRRLPTDLVVQAVQALGSFGGPMSERVLDDLARRGPEPVRQAAAEALARVRGRRNP